MSYRVLTLVRGLISLETCHISLVEFGKEKTVHRSFNRKCFDRWPRIHWDVKADRVFCHVCITAIRQLKLQPTTAEASFLYKGCENWKDACVVFPRHEESLFHKRAVQAVIIFQLPQGMLQTVCYGKQPRLKKEIFHAFYRS